MLPIYIYQFSVSSHKKTVNTIQLENERYETLNIGINSLAKRESRLEHDT